MERETPTGAPIDRGVRQGSMGLLLLLALVLVSAAFAAVLLDEQNWPRFILWFLGLFAAIGVIALFLYAIGVLQPAGRSARNDLTKLALDSSRDGHLIVEREGRILYANAAYQALCGPQGGEATIRAVERLFSGPADVTEACYRLAQAAREGRSASEEIRLVPALSGGDVGWYRVRVRPLERAGRTVIHWVVSDITREREGQENVFQELQHAIDYLDHAPAGFFSASPDGTVAYINATLAGWLDLDIAQHMPGSLRLADIVSGDGAALLKAVTGPPGSIKNETIDLDLKRANGRTVPVRLFHRVAFAVDGTPGPSRTLVLNRSQGEDVAEGLRAAEVRFARFFNNTPLAIATLNRAGKVQRSNAPFARLFPGVLSASETSATLMAAVPPGERATLAQAFGRALEGRGEIEPVDAELMGEGKRSARFFFAAAEERESDDEVAIVYAIETTEQKKLQEQFFQAQKMTAIGQLAGGVAHDFNNHLQSIIGFADLLLANYRSTDPRFQDVMQIKNSANRATSLVRQLLAFSRQQTLRPETMQLSDQLSDLSAMLRRSIGPKVELDVRHGRDLWPVFADPSSFDNMIINLAVNARDAMPEGGRLSIRTRNVAEDEAAGLAQDAMVAADYVLVAVEDTGSGMPPEVKEKIFEPFFTTKEVGRGTGLGLSSVYGFVKQSGGFIFCESTPGKGTAFSIYLPRHIPKASEAERLPGDRVAPSDLTGQATILLVEDEDTVRTFGARALASKGYTVLQASSGVEALEQVNGKLNDIDLVVSDVVMPEMDGPTLLRELRSHKPDLKVIFVSGYAEEAFRKNLPDGQQFDFLPKPFTLKQLLETVKTVIG